MKIQRFIQAIACIFICSTISYATNTIDVRLSHNSINKNDNTLFVNIEVRAEEHDKLILAGQNYRIYYPSDKLSLDEKGSKSQLSPSKYSGLKFSNILENIEANGEGAINFDSDLGFANFAVELLDNKEGGDKVAGRDGWITIATLKFDIVDEFDEVSMVWGREGMSDTYATAFVEIAEWEAPLRTKTLNINEYFDYSLELSSIHLDGSSFDISIGPNPSSDFIEIKSDKALTQDAQLEIKDITGKLVLKQALPKGSSSYYVDLAALQGATYIIDLGEKNGTTLLSQKIVVAK